jgi:hypothetical protein
MFIRLVHEEITFILQEKDHKLYFRNSLQKTAAVTLITCVLTQVTNIIKYLNE